MLVGMEMWIYTWIQTVTFFLYSASCLKINIVILHLYFLSILCLSVGLFLINTLIVCWFISYQYFACLLVYFLLILCLSVNLLVSKKRQKGRTDPSKICLKNLTWPGEDLFFVIWARDVKLAYLISPWNMPHVDFC